MSSDGKNKQPWNVDIDEITGSIIETAIRIHRELGPRLLESVYDTVLVRAPNARVSGCNLKSEGRYVVTDHLAFESRDGRAGLGQYTFPSGRWRARNGRITE